MYTYTPHRWFSKKERILYVLLAVPKAKNRLLFSLTSSSMATLSFVLVLRYSHLHQKVIWFTVSLEQHTYVVLIHFTDTATFPFELLPSTFASFAATFGFFRTTAADIDFNTDNTDGAPLATANTIRHSFPETWLWMNKSVGYIRISFGMQFRMSVSLPYQA